MIRRGSLLVKLVKLVDHIPAPPPQEKLNRGRPKFYSDQVFLKAVIIMIVKHLHKVGELLCVLEEPTEEMQTLRQLLTQEGRYPSRRTWERRLKQIPLTLPAQIGCLAQYSSGSYLLSQDGSDNPMSEFLFLGVPGWHARILPSTSSLKLWHCRFVLNKALRCAHPEAVARYALHVYLCFGRNVLDHISDSGNTDCSITHFAILIYPPEQWPFTHARKPLVFFNGRYGALLEIDFPALCFLVSL